MTRWRRVGGVANQEQAALRLALEYLYFKRELGLD
jgi:hypothetical protein